MTAALILALAIAQPQQPAEAVPARPSLPFESGSVQVVNRANAAQTADCNVAATSQAWRVYGDATCRRLVSPWPGAPIEAAVRESTMVIEVAVGADATPQPSGRGAIAVDQEAEVFIAADGSVSQCRPLRETSATQMSERARICGGLMREGPGLFVAAPGTAERRARLRITFFNWEAAAN